MICFPNAKINLGLNITEKRADGFHNIETVFYPIKWNDALELIESKNLEVKTDISINTIEKKMSFCFESLSMLIPIFL